MSSQMSTMSTPDLVTPVPTSSLDHDDSEYWWDSYVTEFPTNFYVFLSQADYDELFSDDEEFYTTDEIAYATDEITNVTDEITDPTDKFTDPTDEFTTTTFVTDVAKWKCAARNYFALIKMPNRRLLQYRPAAAAAQIKSISFCNICHVHLSRAVAGAVYI